MTYEFIINATRSVILDLPCDYRKLLKEHLPEILKTEDVANYARVSELTIRRLVNSKKLAAFKIDEGDATGWRYQKREVLAFLGL